MTRSPRLNIKNEAWGSPEAGSVGFVVGVFVEDDELEPVGACVGVFEGEVALVAVEGFVVGVGLEVWLPGAPPMPPLFGVGVFVASITTISVGDEVAVAGFETAPDVIVATGVAVRVVPPIPDS